MYIHTTFEFPPFSTGEFFNGNLLGTEYNWNIFESGVKHHQTSKPMIVPNAKFTGTK
jgi:hypothetical protein